MDASAALWRPQSIADADDGDETVDISLQKQRRTLLFHIAAVVDVNECQLECIDPSPLSRDANINVLCRAVVRESIELDNKLQPLSESLEPAFGILYSTMVCLLKSHGRREPSEALAFWKTEKDEYEFFSPKPFNTIARACFSYQASSAAAERLFSDVERWENNHPQSQHTAMLEMSELIRLSVMNELKTIKLPQTGMMHPTGAAFDRLADRLAREIADT